MDRSVDEVLDDLVRSVPDWPEPGVTFRDVTPLLADPAAFATVVGALATCARDLANGAIDTVVGIEARGFIFGAPVALELGAGFVPARKAGKLPGPTHAVSYELEYGRATLEIQTEALTSGARVLVIDDVLATGGTMAAVDELVSASGAVVVANVVLLELAALGGRDRVDRSRLGVLRSL